NKLYAVVAENNLPSIKLFEKLKFAKEAVLKESVYLDSGYFNQIIFSLLKKNYEQEIGFYNS
ncbi:MAG: GNAT family N-acetyltransferase, partial [Candidatus Calescibacterium sp.]|nr:GNAT family N-acetyltransferase [Candidatus Calescibacterium sp.]